jgi:hypothetical protein
MKGALEEARTRVAEMRSTYNGIDRSLHLQHECNQGKQAQQDVGRIVRGARGVESRCTIRYAEGGAPPAAPIVDLREREREREGERASDRCQPRVSPAVDKEREEAGEGRWGRLPPGAGGRPSATGLEARRRGRLTRRAHQTLEGVVEGGRLLLQLRR